MPSTGILAIIALLLVAIIALLVALLVSQRRTRIAAEEAAERVIPDPKRDIEHLLQQIRDGVVGISDRSARTAMEDVGLHVMAALGYTQAPPQQLAAAPHGADSGYVEHRGYDGFATQQTGWATVVPADDLPGHDHTGARNQMAVRTGRPPFEHAPHGEPDGRISMDGYEEVAAGYRGALVITNDQQHPASVSGYSYGQPAYDDAPSPNPGDTASFSAVGPNGEPAEFSAANFQRRPDESEQSYRERIHGENGLQERYQQWLSDQLERTGSFPAGLGQTAAARDALAAVARA